MGNQSVISIEAVIDYIESHLDGKLELETVGGGCSLFKISLTPTIYRNRRNDNS